MTPRIFAYIERKGASADEAALELLGVARKIDAARPPTAILTGWGSELDAACEGLRNRFGEIWKISDPALAYPNAEVVRTALARILPHAAIVLVAHTHFGVDLSPGLSIKMDAAYVPDMVGIDGIEGQCLKVVRQEFGGQVSAHVRCDVSCGAVLNVRPGAFEAADGLLDGGCVIDKSSETGPLASRRRYIETIAAEAGDIDISRQQVLVSIGRGIQEEDNVAIAQELADALGAAVSCSRPVVDAKWLDKSRQVGSSGQTVKPKVYLACGISGSFQHMAGVKGNPFIVAINKNPNAPVFRVADVGIVDDILEFLPQLTERIRAM